MSSSGGEREERVNQSRSFIANGGVGERRYERLERVRPHVGGSSTSKRLRRCGGRSGPHDTSIWDKPIIDHDFLHTVFSIQDHHRRCLGAGTPKRRDGDHAHRGAAALCERLGAVDQRAASASHERACPSWQRSGSHRLEIQLASHRRHDGARRPRHDRRQEGVGQRGDIEALWRHSTSMPFARRSKTRSPTDSSLVASSGVM